MAHSSSLMTDSIVRKDLESTKGTYDEQHCRYRNARYSDFHELFSSLKAQRNYSGASQYLDSMLVVSEPKDSCIINSRYGENEALFVRTASNYQQKIQNSRYLCSINAIGDALQTYYAADSIYRQHSLDSTLIKREAITSIFIFVTTDSAYIKTCEWMYLNGKLADSGAIIAVMEQKGIQPKATKRWKKLFEAAIKEQALKTDAHLKR
jgi:hypothetical protein